MVRLSPILPLNTGKNERLTDQLPAFYLAETIEGIRGIVGTIEPKSLARIQPASDHTPRTPNSWDEPLHGVYWSDSPLPTAITELSKGTGVTPIPAELQQELSDYFSQASACLIGDETKLAEAIAAGTPSIPVVLWDAASPKLPWLPCHRVISGLKGFQTGWMVCLAREYLFFRDVTAQMRTCANKDVPYDVKLAAELLISRDNETVTMLALTSDGAWRIHSEPGWADGLLEETHPLLREIAAVQLHHIVLPRGVAPSTLHGLQEAKIEVVHDARMAIASVADGAQLAYLLNPIRSERLKELVKQGQMLPANSVALDTAALEVWKHAE